MAAPVFTFFSLYQEGVTVTPNTGAIRPEYGSNGYTTMGCPGFDIYGGSAYDAEVALDISGDSLSDGWLRFRYVMNRHSALQNMVVFSGPTTDLLRIRNVNAYSTDPDLRFEYWGGASWTQIGVDIGSSENVDIDVHWHIDGAAGAFEIYLNGVLSQSVSGDTLHTADTTIDTVAFFGSSNTTSYETSFWHIFVDSVDSRGLYMDVGGTSFAGFYNDFSGGDYTDVNERPGESNWDLDYIIGDAAGEKFTGINTAINASLEASGTVETVIVGFSGAAQTEPALYSKPLIRIGSTDYSPTGSVQGRSEVSQTPSYRGFYGIEVPNYPSTGVAWANVAAVEAAEFGWEMSATA